MFFHSFKIKTKDLYKRYLPLLKRLKKHIAVRAKIFQRTFRNNQIALVFICMFLGVFLGACVLVLHQVIFLFHQYLFLTGVKENLSSAVFIPKIRIFAVPILGGIILAIVIKIIKHWHPHEIVDPVEANALLGGKIGLMDSCNLVLTAVISNAFGASVGMEAGYTQIGSGIFSNVGKWLHLRRDDLRIFVGAGAAAAIATSFNAPLAGTFYGFEMMLGSYTLSALAPVSSAAFAGTLFVRLVKGADPLFSLSKNLPIANWQYIAFIFMGIASGYIGIFTMKLVSWSEQAFKKIMVPDWLRPAIGGLILGLTALIVPQVLGGGQGAIQYNINVGWSVYMLLMILIAKIVASAISLGSGFRGGLFSSSLFIGSLFGSIVGFLIGLIVPLQDGQELTFVLVGMGAVAAAIIGTPMTMVMLVLEITGDFKVAMGVMVGAVTSFLLVRNTFGYSFSTWRFHLRGKPINSAVDIGWLNELKILPLIRKDVKFININAQLSKLRQLVSHRTNVLVMAVDDNGLYEGIVDNILAISPKLDDYINMPIANLRLLTLEKTVLTSNSSVSRAVKLFEEDKTEVLPVIANLKDYRIDGYVTEIDVVRYYAKALEKKREG